MPGKIRSARNVGHQIGRGLGLIEQAEEPVKVAAKGAGIGFGNDGVRAGDHLLICPVMKI